MMLMQQVERQKKEDGEGSWELGGKKARGYID